MSAYSFTAGADYRVFAPTTTGFSGGLAETLRDVIASSGPTMLRAQDEAGAIGSASSAGDPILATVELAPERAAPEWDAVAGIGVFTGSFIINCRESGGRMSCQWAERLKAGEILWSIR